MTIQQIKFSTNLNRVVLIGAGGFIGKMLLQKLKSLGFTTLALTSSQVDLTDESAETKLVALLQPSDSVVMLAAITPDKGRDIAALIRNLKMMKSVHGAVERTDCSHFIYFSSDAVYGLSDSHVSEATPASPRDLYGAAHHTREIMALSLANIPVLVLRPTIVYGFDDTHASYGPNRFRRTAETDSKITLFGNGEETRDHVYVDDVVDLTIRCLTEGSVGIFNIATGASSTFRQVAEIVAKQFDKSVEIISTNRVNPITHRHYDITNLIKLFPDFCFTKLEQGLKRVHKELIDKRNQFGKKN